MYFPPRIGDEFQVKLPVLLDSVEIDRLCEAEHVKYVNRQAPRPLGSNSKKGDAGTEERKVSVNPWAEERHMDTGLLEETVKEGNLWCPSRVGNWTEFVQYMNTAKALIATNRDEISSSWSWETKLGRADRQTRLNRTLRKLKMTTTGNKAQETESTSKNSNNKRSRSKVEEDDEENADEDEEPVAMPIASDESQLEKYQATVEGVYTDWLKDIHRCRFGASNCSGSKFQGFSKCDIPLFNVDNAQLPSIPVDYAVLGEMRAMRDGSRVRSHGGLGQYWHLHADGDQQFPANAEPPAALSNRQSLSKEFLARVSETAPVADKAVHHTAAATTTPVKRSKKAAVLEDQVPADDDIYSFAGKANRSKRKPKSSPAAAQEPVATEAIAPQDLAFWIQNFGGQLQTQLQSLLEQQHQYQLDLHYMHTNTPEQVAAINQVTALLQQIQASIAQTQQQQQLLVVLRQQQAQVPVPVVPEPVAEPVVVAKPKTLEPLGESFIQASSVFDSKMCNNRNTKEVTVLPVIPSVSPVVDGTGITIPGAYYTYSTLNTDYAPAPLTATGIIMQHPSHFAEKRAQYFLHACDYDIDRARRLLLTRCRRHEVMTGLEDHLCFQCGESGNLFACGVKDCGKHFHTNCVNLAVAPNEDWVCPRHTCSVCSSEVDITNSVKEYLEDEKEDKDIDDNGSTTVAEKVEAGIKMEDQSVDASILDNNDHSNEVDSPVTTKVEDLDTRPSALACGTCFISYCHNCTPASVRLYNKGKTEMFKRCLECKEEEEDHRRGGAAAHSGGGHDDDDALKGYKPFSPPSHMEQQQSFLFNLSAVMQCKLSEEGLQRAQAKLDEEGLYMQVFVESHQMAEGSKFHPATALCHFQQKKNKRTSTTAHAVHFNVPRVESLEELAQVLQEAIEVKGGLLQLMKNHHWQPLAKVIGSNLHVIPLHLPSATCDYIE